MSYFSLTFLLYVGRWVLSALVMMPFLWILIKIGCCKNNKYEEFIHLIIIQIIGAFIFFKLDELIFK